MDKVIKVYKKAGETPLDCIHNLKKEHPELSLLPITYAGRLDPLAEGVLLILVGDECNKKDEYLNFPKVYEVEVLFGFATDTYDVMGKLGQTISNSTSDYVSCIQKILPEFIGKINQSYPPYSSRPVNGKPLFMWAREGKLDEIKIPTHNVQIDNIEIIGENNYLGSQLLSKIKEDIGKVKGDFRQEEILKIWEKELKDKQGEKYPVIKLRISCGSGSYMRSIANDIGENLGIPTLALKIIRTKVGEYEINL
ncbi:MAG: hypothetical protein WC241_01995 [Candidatus Paceibacterota bacterium]|jgi:tRNA pseudouridine55 synthase